MSRFPATRLRRLRRHDWTRRLVAESTLSAADFIWPLFIVDGDNKREPVPSMPGIDRLSVDLAVGAAYKHLASAAEVKAALNPTASPTPTPSC